MGLLFFSMDASESDTSIISLFAPSRCDIAEVTLPGVLLRKRLMSL